MDIAAFRVNFPEFTSAVDYPDALLNFWAVVAENLVDDDRWGDLRIQALDLVLAHYVALAKQNQAGGASGGIPGLSVGIVTQKKVGDVSVSYDATSATEPGSGQWAKTTYGQQYMSLSKIFGAGCVQL